MDGADDGPLGSLALGHMPIIDPHPRNVPGGKEAIAAEARGRRNAGYALAEDVRYNERSAAERVNGGLKDDRTAGCADQLRNLAYTISISG